MEKNSFETIFRVTVPNRTYRLAHAAQATQMQLGVRLRRTTLLIS